MAKRKKKAKKRGSTHPVDPQSGSESAIKKDINQLDSSSFRVFSGLVAIFFLAALLAMNDTTSIWHGAEAWTLWQALSDQPNSWLTTFLHAVYDDGPISVFYLLFLLHNVFLHSILSPLSRKILEQRKNLHHVVY